MWYRIGCFRVAFWKVRMQVYLQILVLFFLPSKCGSASKPQSLSAVGARSVTHDIKV